MAILTEGLHTGEFVLSLLPGYQSRENVVVASGQNLGPGTVLGRTGAASAIAVANAGNTGNGTITLDATTPLVAGIREGAYRLTFVEPTTNLGTYEVEGPDGVALGTGVVGGTFNNQLKFVVNDGSTDFVSGDGFVLYVRAGTVTPGTNTGNGTFTLYGTGEGAQVGSYSVAITVAAANAGTFTVTAPDSTALGTGTVGTRFTGGGLDFLIADGSTDFIVGDSWSVANTRGKVKAWNPAAVDGSGGDPYGLLLSAVDATSGDLRGVAIARGAEVSGRLLQYAAGLTGAQQETAKAGLRKRGIQVR